MTVARKDSLDNSSRRRGRARRAPMAVAERGCRRRFRWLKLRRTCGTTKSCVRSASAPRVWSARPRERRRVHAHQSEAQSAYTRIRSSRLQTICPVRRRARTAFAVCAALIIEGERGLRGRRREVMHATPRHGAYASWEWHDHGNEGDRPMIWLDGLDLPLWQVLRVISRSTTPTRAIPRSCSTPHQIAVTRGPRCKRNSMPRGAVAEERYRMRANGGEISATIGASAFVR